VNVRPHVARLALTIAGVATAAFVAYWGMWFSVSVEPLRFSIRGVLFWSALGAGFGLPFLTLAALAHRPSLAGRVTRVLAGLALVAPGWLFGTIAFEHIRRMMSSGGFMAESLIIGCLGFASVLGAVVYAVATEMRDGVSSEV
jgi:hypothetical protein